MRYTDELKIETAKRLKKLRNNKKGANGRHYSHATLSEEITKLNYPDEYRIDEEYRAVSAKSLAYYEVVNTKSEKKFRIGKGMKVETLFMLSTFYGVSCDYLLGLKDNTEIESYTLNETAFEMGLDSYSREALMHMVRHSIAYKEELLTINNIIHSFTVKDDEYDDAPQMSNTQDIEQGFLYLLSRYLFYTSEPQKISQYPNMQYFEDDILDEDELANLLLMELQKNLQISRGKYKKVREYPQKTIKRMIAMRNAKNKKVKND